MATRVEAFFELQDRMSKKLEFIGRTSQQTENKIRDLNLGIDKLTAVQQVAAKSADSMARSMGQMAASAQLTESHVKQLSRQVERLAAELAVLGQMRVEPKVGADTSEAQRKIAGVFAGVGTGGVFAGVGGLGAMTLIGGIVGLVTPAVTMLGALGGAAAAAIPAVAALGGGIAAAMGVGIAAMKPVIEGYGAIKQAEDQIKNAQTFAQRKAGMDALALAQARLTDEQRQFIEDFKALKEEFKTATKPGQGSIFKAVTDLMGTARDLVPVVAPLLNKFAAVLQQAAAGIRAFFGDPREQQLMRRMWEPLVPVFRSFLSIFGNLAKILQGVSIAATPLLQWMLDGINEKLGNIADTAMSDDGLSRWTQWFEDLKPLLRITGTLLGGLWDALKAIARAGRDDLESIVNGLNYGFDSLAKILPALTGALVAVGPVLGAVMDLIVAFVKESQQGLSKDFASTMQSLAKTIRTMTPGIVRTVTTLLRGVIRVIDLLVSAFNKLPDGVQNIVAVGGALALVGTKIPGLRTVLGFLRQIAQVSLGRGLMMLGGLIGGKAGGVIQGLGAKFLERGQTAVNPLFVSVVGGIAGNSPTMVNGGPAGKGGTLAKVGRGAGGAILGVGVGMGVNELTDAVSGNDKLGDFLGGAAGGAVIGGTIGSIFPVVGTGLGALGGAAIGGIAGLIGFAEGGVVNRPTLAMVGEDGPEAIVPLSKPHRQNDVMNKAGLDGSQVGSLVTIGTINVSNGDDYETFVARLRSDIRVAARDVLSVPAG